MEVGKDGKIKLPKVAKVKNKMPAPVQITAEQLLREAKERELELGAPPPKQKISDEEELKAYRLRKRKAFEDNIRKNRTVMINWIKYAGWEESQKEIQRARSVYERALDVDHRNITLWLKYAEMEMRNRQVNHARNIWDRAITILPRANQFWYKYTYMEEMLGNIAGSRQVFERWMEWQPEEQAWHSYINFELRYKELDRARNIYERFVLVHPEVKNWIKYAKFEEKNSYISSARNVYERAVEFFGEENMNEVLIIAFAKFEENQKEHERARVIYKYALDHLPKDKCQEIYKQYTVHEKKFGDRAAIEDVIVSKRRFQYEEQVKSNPHNYDAWFDYLRLLENEGNVDQTRELYERAIANVPPSQEKRHWRRYIYLWINYALFEELEAHDIDRTRQVYQACIEIIPHKKFTFAKIWLLYAHFEIRQKNLQMARKILGASIGKCPKDKLFRSYIDMEIQLREFDRCRILYEKFLEFNPENCTTWMKYAELETILGDVERTRAIYELAIGQPKLDMPEVLWKSYIDFEIEQEEYDRTRKLYRRLLERTQHVKVWASFAQFELCIDDPDAKERARDVYRDGHKAMKKAEEKEERLMLLEAWREYEHEHGTEESLAEVEKQMPKKVKKRKKVQTEDGSDAGWEEYFDYIFPDDEAAQPNLKLLAMAKMWKQKQLEQDSTTEEEEATPGPSNDS
ncbi:crooked neck-like protein 1 isoform X2 [Lingula anatina]|uniref:Crooked neck-like protein 1 n=1 Tax=Lingula anatina TaxID=7574 RepID=A0A1S3HWJ4_LINAN|nr:crooked neck-like protein 1 isoform X2 [Lingula anatina]|eukprot:XP_013390405.1 crooked neck-like protein 1 isoform X2 [Lingula anatina]